MSDELYEDLWWRNHRLIKNSPHVFPSIHPLYRWEPHTSRHHFLKGLCNRVGVKVFGFDALRRYVASVRAEIHKISAKTIPRILRHKNLSTPERYIKRINKALGGTVNLLSWEGYHGGPPGAKEEPNAS
jgi:hypothetical protein